MNIIIHHVDHIVMTVTNIEKTCEFYHRVLNMKIETFNGDRKALLFGNQKINLHLYKHEFEPHALRPAPGTMDICLITETPMEIVVAHLQQLNIDIEQGPVERTGACGKLLSVYIRDPDQNLIEIANQL